nr:hypothetical protein CFP56_36021 [Quercus suber]
MVEKLGFMSYGKLWYRMPIVSLEDGGFRPVTIDNDDLAIGMADAVQGHKVIELYVEHYVDMPNIIDDVGDDINYSENSKDSSGSDDALIRRDNDQPYESEELLSMDDDDDNNAIPP